MGQAIHHPDVAGDLRWWYQPCECDFLADAIGLREALDLMAQVAIADEQQPALWLCSHKVTAGQQQVAMAFERCEPCNLADDKGVQGQAELLAKSRIVFGLKEWVQVKPADNSSVDHGR